MENVTPQHTRSLFHDFVGRSFSLFQWQRSNFFSHLMQTIDQSKDPEITCSFWAIHKMPLKWCDVGSDCLIIINASDYSVPRQQMLQFGSASVHSPSMSLICDRVTRFLSSSRLSSYPVFLPRKSTAVTRAWPWTWNPLCKFAKVAEVGSANFTSRGAWQRILRAHF